SPYGTVTKAGDLIQPVQWSSEMNDEDLELVYYNYRYYNPADGRWINRDPIAEQGDWNLYGFVRNNLNIDNLGLLSNDGSGTVIPNTETEGNCIGIACGTTKPLSPDPEKIPKNVDLNTFLDVIREILIGDCTRKEKNSTQNETQCQECEREIICLAYFYHEAEQIGIEVHCVGRTIPLGTPKQLPPFESKLGVDGNRVTGITNIQNHMVKYIIKPGLDKIHFQDGKMLGQWATYCCKEKKEE
ncbi:RHS repeat-associated core domain-containing protein, partial [uncultured Akkermansia sp.]